MVGSTSDAGKTKKNKSTLCLCFSRTCSTSQSMTSWTSESTIICTACTFSLLYVSSRSERGGEVLKCTHRQSQTHTIDQTLSSLICSIRLLILVPCVSLQALSLCLSSVMPLRCRQRLIALLSGKDMLLPGGGLVVGRGLSGGGQ